MKRTAHLTMITVPLILIGCGSTVYPELKPVEVQVHDIKPCGPIKYERRGDTIIFNRKDADCIIRGAKQCAEDRKELIVANKANVRQMKALKHEHGIR